MRHPRFLLALLVVLTCALTLPPGVRGFPLRAAQPQDPQLDPQQIQVQDQAPPQLTPEQLRNLNKKRQEELKKDTDKLLQLATELKQYVDKSNEHTLSLEVVRKAEQIEKLAHSVKEKMKGM
jgi:hypothetical protein